MKARWLIILLVLLVAGEALAVGQTNARARYERFVSGQSTTTQACVTWKSMTSTANSLVFDVHDNTDTSNLTISREGNLTTVGTVSAAAISGVHINAAAGLQTLAAAATIALSSGASLYPVKGAAGPQTLSTTVPVAAATVVGQTCIIEGQDDTNTITVPINGSSNIAGVHSGTTVVLGNQDILTLLWDGTSWVELYSANNK